MRGAVAAGNRHTAEAGAWALARGGNAVDAVVAAAVAAFVAEGPLTGPAGGGFFLVRDAGAEPTLLDCFFAVPSRPQEPMDEVLIDFGDASTQVFHVGNGSVAVPGLVAGLAEAHGRHGRLSWGELFEPALELAGTGVEMSGPQRFLLEILVPILDRTEEGRGIYGSHVRAETAAMVPGSSFCATTVRPRWRSSCRATLPTSPRTASSSARRWRRSSKEGGSSRARRPRREERSSPEGSPRSVHANQREQDTLAATLVEALLAGYGGAARLAPLTGTTHVSVIDGDGNAAALSSTLGSGSGVFARGFQLNNMLGELDVIGTEDRYPGDRLPSMMAPTLVLEGDAPRLVVGSAGSVRLSGAILQTIYHVVAGGCSVA